MKVKREQRSIYSPAARAFLFNQILASRVTQHRGTSLLPVIPTYLICRIAALNQTIPIRTLSGGFIQKKYILPAHYGAKVMPVCRQMRWELSKVLPKNILSWLKGDRLPS
jgi:hypothetical protein